MIQPNETYTRDQAATMAKILSRETGNQLHLLWLEHIIARRAHYQMIQGMAREYLAIFPPLYGETTKD